MTIEQQGQALANAKNNASLMNYSEIFSGFAAKGILDTDIEPRVNVFTFHAWKALGRQVKKGEHGVKILTWVPMHKKSKVEGEPSSSFRAPRTTTVFHVSQTDPLT